MPVPTHDRMTDTAYAAAHTRMSAIFDRAAEMNGVSPDAFRAAIREAMQYADAGKTRISDTTPEAFVLTLLGTLL